VQAIASVVKAETLATDELQESCSVPGTLSHSTLGRRPGLDQR
jgi:hypothetical protein